MLPASYKDDPSNTGRATAAAALALKSRLLLYAASALQNPSNDMAKWTASSTATKEAIDYAESNGYKLYAGDYKNIFMEKNNAEILMSYNWSKIPGGGIDIVCQPNSYGGWSVYTPSQAMVDAFEMKDGTKFDWNNQALKANPYANRDPRLYASVLFEGADWFERSSEVKTIICRNDGERSSRARRPSHGESRRRRVSIPTETSEHG